MAANADGDEVSRVGVYSNCKVANDLITHIVCEAAFVGVLVRRHELVHNAGKVVYNCALEPCLAVDCFEVATDSIRRGVAIRRTAT